MEILEFQPKNKFLEKVRNLQLKKRCFNFDECQVVLEIFGGLHLKYNVKPDICILGKALGLDFQSQLLERGRNEVFKILL